MAGGKLTRASAARVWLDGRGRQVVVDSMNYIKGFRYELYCVARTVGVPHCVVHIAASDAQCAAWNEAGGQRYSPTLLAELVARFEAPNANTRWDSPLFTVTPDEPLPLAAITAALRGAPAKPNVATQEQRMADPAFLHNLDRGTQDVVAAVLAAQQQRALVPGDKVPVPGVPGAFFIFRRPLAISELRRLRQQVAPARGTLFFPLTPAMAAVHHLLQDPPAWPGGQHRRHVRAVSQRECGVNFFLR